jgi:hypothetical protein
VIGLDATAELFVKLGGAVIHLPCSSTRPDGHLRSVLKEEQILALARALSPGGIRIPLANQFLARYYRVQEPHHSIHCPQDQDRRAIGAADCE